MRKLKNTKIIQREYRGSTEVIQGEYSGNTGRIRRKYKVNAKVIQGDYRGNAFVTCQLGLQIEMADARVRFKCRSFFLGWG